MSAIKRVIIRTVTLFAFIIISGYGLIRAQIDIITPNLVSPIDTTDYFPPEYPSALDYNLMIAASNGYNSEIKRLIAKGANINAQTLEGATPLIFAVNADNLFSVATLLLYNPDIEKITHNNETALMIAVKNGYLDISEALIRAGADVEYTDNHGVTPLHFAALYNYFEMVDLFIYYDAPLGLQTDEGTTPLLAAIWAGNTDIADLLIQNGAPIEESDNDGFTPFLLASFYGDTTLMNVLYKKGANIYATNKAKHNALTISISRGDKVTTEFLLKKGDKWTEQLSNSWDPYVVASKYRRNEMVEMLKQYKVPGELKYGIDQVAFTASSRIYTHNLITGLSLSFKEPNINAGFTLGCDIKLWDSRLLLKESENSYFQYMVRESMVYGGVFKDFPLSDNLNTFNYAISTSLSAGYTFGNNLKGTLITTGNQVKLIPAVTLKMTKQNLSMTAGFEYIKSDFYQNGPVWFRLGIAYNYFFDNIRIKVKPIKW